MNDKTNTALVIGATSDIGRAIARRLAKDGYGMQLAARDPVQLDREEQDLRVHTDATVTLHLIDVMKADDGLSLLDELDPLPDIVVCAIGLLGDHNESMRDPAVAAQVMQVNYTGSALLMGALAERFEARGSGILVGISSVAGDRGRASNYVYGSAKAGFTAFLSGLRNRLTACGVRVITVKPGFVQTRMTNGMDLPAWLTAAPEEVADAVAKAIHRRRDVVYVRRIWRLIMLVIRILPESIYKRITL